MVETAPVLIEMNHISKIFKTPAGDFPALKDVSVQFSQGEFVSILGKSGSGKSTLINMITGIDHPTTGTVKVAGLDIHSLPESRMAVWRGKNLGVVFQFFQLLPMINVIDNLLLPMDLGGVYPYEERVDRALDLLRLVGLEEYALKMPNELAGGQQQSIAVARALANDPPIIAADEPTGNLDSNTADSVFQIFEELARRGKTIIMVTHDPALAKRTHRSVLLCDGEIIHPLIAESLAMLPHRLMLALTKIVKEEEFVTGELVYSPGDMPGFFLVQSGSAEIILRQAGSVEKMIHRLEKGQYFCWHDWQWLHEKGEDVLLRASNGESLCILAASYPSFDRLIKENSNSSRYFIRPAVLCSWLERGC